MTKNNANMLSFSTPNPILLLLYKIIDEEYALNFSFQSSSVLFFSNIWGNLWNLVPHFNWKFEVLIKWWVYKLATSSYKTTHRWVPSIIHIFFVSLEKTLKHVGKIIAPCSSLLNLTLEYIYGFLYYKRSQFGTQLLRCCFERQWLIVHVSQVRVSFFWFVIYALGTPLNIWDLDWRLCFNLMLWNLNWYIVHI
jgi:hypothetical protein